MEECRGCGATGNGDTMVVSHSLFVDDADDAVAEFRLVTLRVGSDVVGVGSSVPYELTR